MNSNIFNQANIFSVLGIEINQDNFYINFESSDEDDTWSNDFASSLDITTQKDEKNVFMSYQHEDNELLTIKLELNTFIVNNQLVPCIPINNIQVQKAIDLINKYMKLFMVTYHITEFHRYDEFVLNLNIECSNECSLKIIKVSSINTEVYKNYDCYSESIEFNLEDYINNLLKPMGIECLNEDSDIDQLIELFKMQELVEEMYYI